MTRHRLSPALSRLFAALALLCASALASAQVLDRIDAVPRGDKAEIVIHFMQKVLYVRHVPQKAGKAVRIYLRLTEALPAESPLAQETLHTPHVERVPDVTALFPEQAADVMLVSFPQKTNYTVRGGADGRSIVVTVPLLPAPAAPVVIQPVEALPPPDGEAPALSSAELETRAGAFLDEARRAMAAQDMPTAINRLNRVLGMPTGKHTEAAQALVGEAREANGEVAKARAEYELYLKLFPAGAAAARVRGKLAALPKEEPARVTARPQAPEAGPPEWNVFGSVSSYVYHGNSQIQTETPPAPGQLTANRSSLSLTDQKSLISSVNVNARRRTATTDTRVVFRDTDNRNFLTRQRSYNRVYAGYVDHADRAVGYYLRAGRQNPDGIGMMERFDGLQAGYSINPQWRMNAVYGEAVEFTSPYKKRSYGASLDLMPQDGRPGISVYAMAQTLDGMQNRRAVGSEVRYFDGRATAYGMVDYDVLYKGVNIALLQGNYLDEAGNNYFFVLDHRRAPSLALTNALPGVPGLTVNDLVALQGDTAARDQALALTAKSNMFSVGVTHPLSENWQVGGDYRISSLSSTLPVVATLPLAVIGTCLGVIDPVNETCVYNTAAQQASGNNHMLGFQAVGNNLFMPGAVGVGSFTYIKAPNFNGLAWGANYALPFRENWRLDAALRYYAQNDDAGGSQRRVSPSLKLSYQWQNKMYLEAEAGYESSRSETPTQSDYAQRSYVYGGVRYDFR